ncbi:MAG: YggS family pyridoxal phosphate-dependent enzyme [Bacillota bacterium]|uniref:YggS family pyridoxal phosphate-dependent enzyme n=1 Tax=Desulfurispora thermophila TaxID=265470 RepID=UPI00038277F0|nr:YggS family pyridoxal phosphate-dependent enzyme [Desulfurispora thermophila]
MQQDLRRNIALVRQKIARAARLAGRDPAQVTIVAVTKTVTPDVAALALQEGLAHLGENRVQELLHKQEKLSGLPAVWHLIGHLQTNKVKYLPGKVALVHSLDSWHLAREISRRFQAAGEVCRALVQVNVSGEKSKHGFAPGEVADFLAAARELPALELCGFMTMAPLVDEAEEARPVFRQLKTLAACWQADHPALDLSILSMGMSNDYEVAVQEGSTMVRIGSAIFGWNGFGQC